MSKQTYQNHVRMHPLYHYVLLPVLLIILIASIVNVILSIMHGTTVFESIIIFLMVMVMAIVVVLVRVYPLKAQDRAIRAEENLRCYVLTGELLNAQLNMGQVAALRFAGSNEFPELYKRTLEENLKPSDIKKAIQNWKADDYRI